MTGQAARPREWPTTLCRIVQWKGNPKDRKAAETRRPEPVPLPLSLAACKVITAGMGGLKRAGAVT